MGGGNGDIMFVFFGCFVNSVIVEEVGEIFFSLMFGDGSGKSSLYNYRLVFVVFKLFFYFGLFNFVVFCCD